MSISTLMSTDKLAAHLDDPDCVVFDCRFSLDKAERGREDYRRAHIPNARYAHLDDDLADPKGPDTGRHPLPDLERFAAWLGGQGVTAGRQVVAYDDGGGAVASRLWWLMRWVGHDAAAVLDGGWQAWLDGGYPTDDAIPEIDAVTFLPHADGSAWVDAAQVAAAVDEAGLQIVDARATTRFIGAKEPIDPVAGHIPGALNLPFAQNLDQQGRFRSPAELQALYRDLLGDRVTARNVIHMCGSGVTACHNLLAMELAGMTGSRLYVGSWSDWITDPARPVVRDSGAG
jgi:thiosulfate/3-mercaptopyruvate sulfurtransferase